MTIFVLRYLLKLQLERCNKGYCYRGREKDDGDNMPGDNKDKSFNAFIARGEEQGNLAVQIRMSLGILIQL